MPLILFVLSMLVPVIAHAGDTGISLVPAANLLIDYALFGVCGVAAGSIGWVAGRIQKWFGVRIDDSQRAVIMGAVERGVNYAADAAREYIRYNRSAHIDLRSMLIKKGIEYVQGRVPDALAHFKLSPTDVGDMLAAKIEEYGVVGKISPDRTT